MSEGNLKLPNVGPTAYESLLSEAQTIEALGLSDRPNPAGALRWLVRRKKLPVVRIGKGILRFKPSDVARLIDECTG